MIRHEYRILKPCPTCGSPDPRQRYYVLLPGFHATKDTIYTTTNSVACADRFHPLTARAA
jgi:hypothetical protein